MSNSPDFHNLPLLFIDGPTKHVRSQIVEFWEHYARDTGAPSFDDEIARETAIRTRGAEHLLGRSVPVKPARSWSNAWAIYNESESADGTMSTLEVVPSPQCSLDTMLSYAHLLGLYPYVRVMPSDAERERVNNIIHARRREDARS